MLTIHHATRSSSSASVSTAGVAAFIARRRGAGRGVTHLLALAQTSSSPRCCSGCFLLADHKRAADKLHYAYGTFALLAVFAPWLYAPADPRARLLWFAVAMLLAAALGVRAYMTAT